MVKTAYASKPWDYRIAKNHGWVKTTYVSKPQAYRIAKNPGWERVVSTFNAFKTMDGRGWFLHLMFL